MKLNNLRDEAYAIAQKHGWHEEAHSDEHWLMLVITEIAEAVQADRKDRRADAQKFKISVGEYPTDRWFSDAYDLFMGGTVEDELADVVIRLLNLAGLRNLDVDIYDCISLNLSIKFTEHCFHLVYILSFDTMREPKEQYMRNVINYVISYLFVYCKQQGIDLMFFIEQKMKYNQLRPYKHGNKKY